MANVTDAKVQRILNKLQHWQTKALEQAEALPVGSRGHETKRGEAWAFGQAFYLVLNVMREPLPESVRKATEDQTEPLDIAGKWPGNETDAEIAEALRDLS